MTTRHFWKGASQCLSGSAQPISGVVVVQSHAKGSGDASDAGSDDRGVGLGGRRVFCR